MPSRVSRNQQRSLRGPPSLGRSLAIGRAVPTPPTKTNDMLDKMRTIKRCQITQPWTSASLQSVRPPAWPTSCMDNASSTTSFRGRPSRTRIQPNHHTRIASPPASGLFGVSAYQHHSSGYLSHGSQSSTNRVLFLFLSSSKVNSFVQTASGLNLSSNWPKCIAEFEISDAIFEQ